VDNFLAKGTGTERASAIRDPGVTDSEAASRSLFPNVSGSAVDANQTTAIIRELPNP
jgi:hypothetical protein